VQWAAISLDPGASLVSASQWATIAAVFQLGVIAGRVGRARRIFRIVAFCGGLVAVVSLAHQLTGAERVYGWYKPRGDFRVHGVGPLLNPNHLAGYLGFAAILGLGQVLEPKSPTPRMLLGAIVVACVGTALRTGSLGGAGALALGIVLLFAMLGVRWWMRRESPGFSISGALATGAALVGGGAVLAWLGWDRRMLEEMSSLNVAKARLLSWSLPMVKDFAVTGVGRGAFESTFEAYRPAVGTNVSFTHPENFVVQWAAEWGVVGVVGLALLAYLLRPTREHVRTPSNAGAAAAAAALLIQNLADFSLELAGPAIALAVVLGALAGQQRRIGRRAVAQVDRRMRDVAAPIVVLAFASLAAIGGAPDLQAAREAARMALVESDDALATEGMIEAYMRRFPADYYFPLLGAELAERRAADPTRWVQRALERAPNVGRVHLVLARILARRNATTQAMLELRTAVELEPPLDTTVGTTAVRWSADPLVLARAVPDIPVGVRVFEAMTEAATKRGDDRLAEALDGYALERFPDAAVVRMRIVQRLQSRLVSGTCEDREACITALRQHAAYLIESSPDSSQGDVVNARVSLAQGDADAARGALRSACNKPRDRQPCLAALAEIEEADLLPAVIERSAAMSCGSPAACAATYDWASGIFASRNLWAQAYGAAAKAARTQPSAERWSRAAAFAARAGMPGEQSAAEREGARMQRR
jgi:hypothetical protein